jgi:hypothetical protein
MSGDTLPAFQAVDDYLDDLLSDAPAPLPAPAAERDSSWPPSTSGYLICTAAGVVIAMPMNQVADILPASPAHGDEVQADDGDTRRRVRVVDLARLLADDLHEPAADMLVVLHGWRWALACRSTEEETSRIASADIDWRVARAERRSRPWLGGMCKNGRRVVLDVTALLDMLDRDHRGNPSV